MSRLTPGGIGTITTSIDTTGLATSANQTTLIGHVDGIEGLLSTIDTSLNDIEAALETAGGLVVNLGANNDVTVTSGTIDLGATDNAVLDAIAASVAAIDTDATTIIGHVDGIETALTAANASLDAIEASVAAIDTDTSTIITHTSNSATSLGIMDDWDNGASDGASISGDVAHDTPDAGEPVKIGGKALDLGATPTAVTANDRVNAAFLRNGVQLTLGGDFNVITKNLNVSDADGAQTDVALVTVTAGTAIVVTMIQVYLDAATTATGGVQARIGFGTANTPALDAAGVIFSHSGIAAGSGAVVGNGSGIIGIGASNEDLRLTCEDPAGGNLDIIVTYFTIAIG